jgi:hypothetical protein
LEASAGEVSVHPKIIGISSELILGAIEAFVETEVLRGEKTYSRGRDMVAGDLNVKVLSIFTNESPTNEPTASQWSKPVDSLDHDMLVRWAFMIDDEVTSIRGDGESASGIEYDVDDFGVGTT